LKKVSSLTIIAIAIILIIGVIYYYEEMKEVKVDIATTPVVVVKDDIPENTVITEDMVSIDKRHTNDLLKEQDLITSQLDKVVGKRTRVPLYANETVKLNRILDNEPYMSSDNLNKKQVAFKIVDTDKALDIKKGDYIDIWLEPSKDGIEVSEVSKKLFEKLQIVQLDNDSHNNLGKSMEKNGETESVTPTYITIELVDTDIEMLLNIDEVLFALRISYYGDDKFYKVVGEVIERQITIDKIVPVENTLEKLEETTLGEIEKTDKEATKNE